MSEEKSIGGMSAFQMLTTLANVFRNKAGFHDAFGHEERGTGLREAAEHCDAVAVYYEPSTTLYVDTSKGFWCGQQNCSYWSLSREDFDTHWRGHLPEICKDVGPMDCECALPKGHTLPHRDAEVPVSWPRREKPKSDRSIEVEMWVPVFGNGAHGKGHWTLEEAQQYAHGSVPVHIVKVIATLPLPPEPPVVRADEE